ncbi:PPE domain-containing protein [Nocardia brasiliensis]|uniref:PPE domain-containing protein n=1 Tax=Nocardia brasiliensis TaxID=37326 RepID=UPI00245520E5|nr:PPE domain-containing protein [Nocardia brasiliensis]
MAGLSVDPGELVTVAAQLADAARTAGTTLPRGWVPPAGSDPISKAKVPELDGKAAALLNQAIKLFDQIQRTASNIGAAAQEYTRVDDDNARLINGGSGPLVTNPIGDIMSSSLRRPPRATAPGANTSVDPLVFAEQLHAGPGAGPAGRYADAIRKFAAGLQLGITTQVGSAANAIRNWTPTGTKAAALLERYRGQLSQVAAGLGALADDIDNYGNAFSTAKAKHPTPQEIKATRKELVAAMRSKNELRAQKALAEFQEQKVRSAETVTGYSTAAGADAPRAVGSAAAASSAAASGANPGAGAGDSSMINSLLPTLMSAMSSLAPMSELAAPASAYDESEYGYDYGDYAGLPDYSSAGSPGTSDIGAPMDTGAGIPDPASTSEQFNVAAMPSVTSSSAANASPSSTAMPRAPVIDPLTGSPTRAANPGMTSPMMPYVPMSPGMGPGGGGGSERTRVVAWHPDRVMFVDDTPHIEQVIGERPSIAPSVTPLTPTPNQNSSQTGGLA